jgi:riboflavin biosynthesis pyrimidine reductase
VFALHRALADVIMVGAGTVRAEGYRAVDLEPWQHDVRAVEGLAPYPLLAIISASGQIDPTVATPVSGPGGAVLLITTEAATGPLAALRDAGVEIVQFPGMRVDLGGATALLGERGLSRVLCEGGPRLHRDLLAADLVDEVSLTVSPLMVGGQGMRSTRGAALPQLRGFALHHVLYAPDETLFTHYRRPAAEPAAPPIRDVGGPEFIRGG